jgi:hypothetical protein
MTNNHDGGKGDKQIQPKDQEQFNKNWDEIFNKTKEKSETNNDQATILASIPFGR